MPKLPQMHPEALDRAAAECALIAMMQPTAKLADGYNKLARNLRAAAVAIRRSQIRLVT